MRNKKELVAALVAFLFEVDGTLSEFEASGLALGKIEGDDQMIEIVGAAEEMRRHVGRALDALDA